MTSRTIKIGGNEPNARLWVARASWVALAALALWLWGLSSVVIIREPHPPAAEATDPGLFTLEDTEALRQLGLPEVLATVPVAFFLLLDVGYFLLGGWIFWRRSKDWMALLLSFALVGAGAMVISYAFEVFSRGNSFWLLPSNLLTFLVIVALILLLYLFPDGKFVPSWTRFASPFLAVLIGAFFLPLPEALKLASSLIAALTVISVGIYSRVHRYRHYSSPVERQQTKWIGLGLLALVTTILFWFPSLLFFPPSQPSTARVYYLLTLLPLGALVALLFPVSVAVSVLGHRLWHIDIYANRTAVYGPLSGILMGTYIGSIRLFQGLFVRFTGEQSDLSILFSTLVLAGVFWPLRQRLQALADRYFKETPDPSNGLKVFESQMRSMAQFADVGHVTRRLLDETMAAFHAESGAVFLQQGGELRLAQTAGAWSGTATITVPLLHGEVRLGEMAIGPRHKGQGYTPQDSETLRAVGMATGEALALALRTGSR